MSIFGKARDKISWWVENIPSASSAINHGSPEFSIKSDVSLDGWGATLNSSVTGGRTQDESEFHINYLELLACFLALKAFFRDHTNIHVQIKSDSATAVSYISHMGGIVAEELLQCPLMIWQRTSGFGAMIGIYGFLHVIYPVPVMYMLIMNPGISMII